MLPIWREPLLHFLLIGVALFGLHAILNPATEEDAPRTIVVNEQSLLTHLQYRSRAFEPERFRQILEAMPGEQLSRLAQDYVREEALYREARAMALGSNDYVARLRLVQQLEFLFRGFVDVDQAVSDEDLNAYWQAHSGDYREPARITFTHIFFSDQHGEDEARARAEVKLQRLERDPVPFAQAVSHGDRFLYHSNYVERGHDMVASHFGDPLADAVFALEPDPGTWRGPIRSAHGYHLVLLTRHREERVPSLNDLRDQVARDARDALVEDKVEALIEAVVADYQVRVSGLEARLDDKGNAR